MLDVAPMIKTRRMLSVLQRLCRLRGASFARCTPSTSAPTGRAVPLLPGLPGLPGCRRAISMRAFSSTVLLGRWASLVCFRRGGRDAGCEFQGLYLAGFGTDVSRGILLGCGL